MQLCISSSSLRLPCASPLQQARQHVDFGVARAAPAFGQQSAQVAQELHDGGVGAVQQRAGRRRFQRRQDGKRPLAQGCALGMRHREQVADHLDRDLRGEVLDQVGRGVGGQRVEQVVDQPHQAGLHARDRPLVQRAHQDAAHTGVQRRVAEHQAGRVVAVDRRAGAQPCRELQRLVGARLRRAIDRQHVVVAGQQHAVGCQPVPRPCTAQRCVPGVGVVDEAGRRVGQREGRQRGVGRGRQGHRGAAAEREPGAWPGGRRPPQARPSIAAACWQVHSCTVCNRQTTVHRRCRPA
jgi:hypothetical protein